MVLFLSSYVLKTYLLYFILNPVLFLRLFPGIFKTEDGEAKFPNKDILRGR